MAPPKALRHVRTAHSWYWLCTALRWVSLRMRGNAQQRRARARARSDAVALLYTVCVCLSVAAPPVVPVFTVRNVRSISRECMCVRAREESRDSLFVERCVEVEKEVGAAHPKSLARSPVGEARHKRAARRSRGGRRRERDDEPHHGRIVRYTRA